MQANHKPLSYRDLTIFHHHEIEDKTLEETAALVNVSRETVKRTTHKEAYNELAIQALESKAIGLERYAELVDEQSKAKKSINISGKEVEVVDNSARGIAMKEIGNVYGLYAPREISLHSVASIPDEELADEISKAAQDQLGGVQREQIAGEGNAEAVEGTIL